MSDILNTPGGEMAKRPLEFFFICDCSGSMYGNKIESLNAAIRSAIPAMQDEARQNPHAQLFVRAIKFSTSAEWHLASRTEVENFSWVDLDADGVTEMGAAFKLVAKEMKMPPMSSRGLRPVMVLVSDGLPTDDWESGLKTLMSERWARKAIRIAIAIEGNFDLHPLKSFTMGDPALADSLEMCPHQIPLIAKNAAQLAKYIKWASTVVQKAASAPPSKSANVNGQGGAPGGPDIISPPVVSAAEDVDDAW